MRGLVANENSITLKLAIRDVSQNEIEELWQVECDEVASYQIVEPWDEGLSLFDQHVVLWPHVLAARRLYFASAPENPDDVVAELVAAHFDLCGDWISFDKYRNRNQPFRLLIAGGHGLIADGPSSIVERYFEILKSHGMSPTLSADPPILCADGRPFLRDAAISALIWGRSFICAKSFRAEHVGTAAA